jgi:hypothetical protein
MFLARVIGIIAERNNIYEGLGRGKRHSVHCEQLPLPQKPRQNDLEALDMLRKRGKKHENTCYRGDV